MSILYPGNQRTLLLIALLLLSFVHPGMAQSETLTLMGPLLALNTVERDAVILYDLGTDRYRRLELGVAAHDVWDFSPDGCRLSV